MGLPALKFPEEPARVSAEDYLRLEINAETRHEYANGRVWAMAGAEMAHNDINYNLNQAIGPQLRPRGCKRKTVLVTCIQTPWWFVARHCSPMT